MGTKKEGFHRISTGGDLGKSRASSLGSVLRLPTVSTTLQELGIVKPKKNSIFMKNVKTVICCYSTGGKF